MNLSLPSGKSWVGAALGVGLTIGLGLVLHLTPLGEGLTEWSYDLFFIARPNVATDDAVIVYMDDESHAALNQPFNAAWDRTLHARLVDRLTRAGAKAVVFDVVFSDPATNPAVDQDLARAMESNGRVILAADTVPAGYGIHEVNMRTVTPPTEALREKAAHLGSAELLPSQDLVIRRHFHGSVDDILSSLSWAAAEVVEAPVTLEDTQGRRPMWLNYYGPPGSIPSVSYSRAMDTNAVPDFVFKDRVVFIGARLFTVFAGERKDEFRTPYSYWVPGNKFMSGVEIQATVFLNLMRGDWLQRSGAAGERLGLILCGILLSVILLPFPPARAAVHAAGAVVVIVCLSYLSAARLGVWVPWLLPVVQAVFALISAVACHYTRIYIRSQVLENSLSLHTSPHRVRQLLKQPELLKPGATKQELTILFSDIANFTKISENMDSDDLARVMNNYFETAITHCIQQTDGYVVKYIGDAIFAIWNAPLGQEDHRERACEAAQRLREQVVNFDGEGDGLVLETRIGLHTGLANVGNFGSFNRVDYTAIGESVNLASRMEGLNKHIGTHVLVTRDTQIAIEDRMLTRQVGHFCLKGFEKTVEVYELIGSMDLAEKTKPWRETFATGLVHFRSRHFEAAKAAFKKTLELNPDDGPSQFYLSQLVDLLPEFLPDDWSGEIRLDEK